MRELNTRDNRVPNLAELHVTAHTILNQTKLNRVENFSEVKNTGEKSINQSNT